MKRNSRGMGDPATLIVLAVALALSLSAPSGGPGKKHWWEFWKKNPIEQVQKADAELAAAKAKAEADLAAANAAINAQREKQLIVAHEAAFGTTKAIGAAQAAVAAGKSPDRELNTAEQLAKTNVQAMDQARGPLAPERVRELELMVTNLNAELAAQRAAGAQSLQLMQTVLDTTVKEKAAEIVKRTETEAKNKDLVTKAEQHVATLTKIQQDWALERDAIARKWERATFWAIVGGVIFVIIAGYALFLVVRVRGLTNFGKDAVGMTEYLKDVVKKHGGEEVYAATKKKMSEDWMLVSDGTAKLVDKFKKELRL